MKPLTISLWIGCSVLFAVSSAQARPVHHISHRHVLAGNNDVHKKVIVRPAPVRSKYYHLTTVRLRTLPAGFVRLVHNDDTYYYANGLYYVEEPLGYVQRSPVVGLRVASLPPAHTRIRIGTETLYRYNNTHYRKINGFFIVV